MSQLGALVIVLLMVSSNCNAACAGDENTPLTFDLQGVDLSTASGTNWFYYGLEGNESTTIAIELLGSFTSLGRYTSRLTRQATSNVNLILSRPADLDGGKYGCVIAFSSGSSTALKNISLALFEGADPGNLSLSLTLTFNKSAEALQCNIEGLTSLGDAVLAISGDDGTIIGNGTSLPLTVAFKQAVTDQNSACFLTGPGAECSNVTSNGTVTVQGLGTSAGTTPSATTEVTPGPVPNYRCWPCIIILVFLAIFGFANWTCIIVFFFAKCDCGQNRRFSAKYVVLWVLSALVVIFEILVLVLCLVETCPGLRVANIIFIVLGFTSLPWIVLFTILRLCCSINIYHWWAYKQQRLEIKRNDKSHTDHETAPRTGAGGDNKSVTTSSMPLTARSSNGNPNTASE